MVCIRTSTDVSSHRELKQASGTPVTAQIRGVTLFSIPSRALPYSMLLRISRAREAPSGPLLRGCGVEVAMASKLENSVSVSAVCALQDFDLAGWCSLSLGGAAPSAAPDHARAGGHGAWCRHSWCGVRESPLGAVRGKVFVFLTLRGATTTRPRRSCARRSSNISDRRFRNSRPKMYSLYSDASICDCSLSADLKRKVSS
jgi:hypothetical protein